MQTGVLGSKRAREKAPERLCVTEKNDFVFQRRRFACVVKYRMVPKRDYQQRYHRAFFFLSRFADEGTCSERGTYHIRDLLQFCCGNVQCILKPMPI